MEVFDKDGKPVENVFSQEELDEQKKEAVETAIKEAEEAAAEAAKKAEEETAATTGDDKSKAPEADDVASQIKALTDTVNNLVKSTESVGSSKFTLDLDEEKKAAFNTQFEALQKTGNYENTAEGIEKRSADAYMLATGEKFDAGNFNMQNLSATGGKAPTKPATEMSETDKQISEALGNTEEDFKKHSANPTT